MIALNKKTIVPKELTENDILKKYVRKQCSRLWELESASVDIYSVITDAGIKISSHSFDHPKHAALKLSPNQIGAEIILRKDYLLSHKDEECLKYDAANRLAYLLVHEKQIKKLKYRQHNIVFYKLSHGTKIRDKERYIDRLARRILMPERLILACLRCLCSVRDKEICFRCSDSCLSINPNLSAMHRLMCLFCKRERLSDSSRCQFHSTRLVKNSKEELEKYFSILEDSPQEAFVNMCNLSDESRCRHPFFDFLEDKNKFYGTCIRALGFITNMSELLGVTIEDFKQRINDLSD